MQVTAGHYAVTGSTQQFAQICEYVGGGIHTHNAGAGWRGDPRHPSSFIERGDCVLFRSKCVKQTDDFRELQDFVQVLWYMTQFQIASRPTCAGQQADEGSEPTAVNEIHISQVQDNIP